MLLLDNVITSNTCYNPNRDAHFQIGKYLNKDRYMLKTIALLTLSNIFMTYAWYGHLKALADKPIWIAIFASWGIAFFEYCFQVPANREGYQYFSLGQLKIIQEVLTMVVFSLFAVFFMKEPLNRNFLYSSLCLVGAVYFIFRK